MVEKFLVSRRDKEAFVESVHQCEYPLPEADGLAKDLAKNWKITREGIIDAVKNSLMNPTVKVGVKNILLKSFDAVSVESPIVQTSVAESELDTNSTQAYQASSTGMPWTGRATAVVLAGVLIASDYIIRYRHDHSTSKQANVGPEPTSDKDAAQKATQSAVDRLKGKQTGTAEAQVFPR